MDEAPLQGPFAFNPGLARVAGSLPVAVPVALFVPVLFVIPMPVVPGVVLGEDMPAAPPVAPPAEPVPAAPPAAPPPAPPPPPPAAKVSVLERASVAASFLRCGTKGQEGSQSHVPIWLASSKPDCSGEQQLVIVP